MLKFQHSNPTKVRDFALQVVGMLKSHFQKEGCELVGPAEAPLSKVKRLFRWQCLVKADSVRLLQQTLRTAIHFSETSKSNVQMITDVDPINFL